MSDDDFSKAMSDVMPLAGKQQRQQEKHLQTERIPAEVTLAQLEKRDAALGVTRRPLVDPNPLVLSEVALVLPHDPLVWKKDGVQHEVFQRLKSGRYPVEGSLDLHRLTVKESREALWKFFALAEAKRWRTVLIAHGRGEKSATPARLKSYVNHWLGQLPQVIAYHSAERRQGGTGAVLVLVKKSAEAKEATREQFGMKSDRESDTP